MHILGECLPSPVFLSVLLVIQLQQDSVVQHQQLGTHHQACRIEFKQEWSHSS